MFSVDLPKTLTPASDLTLVPISRRTAIDIRLYQVAGAQIARPTIGFIAPRNALPETIVVSPSALLTNSVAGAVRPTDERSASCAEGSGQDIDLTGSGGNNKLLLVTPDKTPEQVDLRLGEFGRGSSFPPQVDFGSNSLRVTSMWGEGGLPRTLCLLVLQATQSTQANQDLAFKTEGAFPRLLDWQPVERQARRIPVLFTEPQR